jgi:hypothetical protein
MVKFIRKTILPASVQQLNPTVDGEVEGSSCSWAGETSSFLLVSLSNMACAVKLFTGVLNSESLSVKSNSCKLAFFAYIDKNIISLRRDN